jgi:SAM-dependent methyltransferase
MTIPPDWFALNLANWNERVPIHLNAPPLHYDLDPLRNGTEHLDAIATDILGPVDGLRVLHLQCHFGKDTLTIAQQGASVTGLDFSPPAIAAARSLAADLGLTDRARFVQANIYDAETAINEPGSFDRVFASWGALVWLPDIPAWARIVSSFLKPNGFLALAEAHPAGRQAGMAYALPGPATYVRRLAGGLRRSGGSSQEQPNRAIPASFERYHHVTHQRRVAHRPIPRTRQHRMAVICVSGKARAERTCLARQAVVAVVLFIASGEALINSAPHCRFDIPQCHGPGLLVQDGGHR